MKDRLIEMIVDAENKIYQEKPYSTDAERIDRVVSHLLANGVIVPLVQNGQTVYTLTECSCENIDGVHTECEYYGYGEDDRICQCEGECPYVFRVDPVFVSEHNKIYASTHIGETIFLTEEDAEKALAEREGKG